MEDVQNLPFFVALSNNLLSRPKPGLYLDIHVLPHVLHILCSVVKASSEDAFWFEETDYVYMHGTVKSLFLES